MSKNPTIAQLVSTALTVATNMTADAAKAEINANKLRSYSKVTAHFANLVAKAIVADAAEKATQAIVDLDAAKKVDDVAPKAKRIGRIRSTRTISAGPRGFTFGNKWNDSVKAQAGIAVHPTYLAKLQAQAESFGIPAADFDQVTLAKAVATVLVAA